MKTTNPETGKMEDVRLPKEFKEKWIAALRSGKFKQGSGYLQDGDEYCCLGVACRIAHPKMDIQKLCLIGVDDFGESKIKKIKVPSIIKGGDTPSENKIVSRLTKMNDKGKSFKTIANYIEKNL
jgi:hypothetical protein